MAGHADTKTIDQFLAENPNVDVTPYWERCWGILAGVKDRIAERFPDLEREENTRDRDYYTSSSCSARFRSCSFTLTTRRAATLCRTSITSTATTATM